MNLNHLFDKRLSETELMLGETESAERKRPTDNDDEDTYGR